MLTDMAERPMKASGSISASSNSQFSVLSSSASSSSPPGISSQSSSMQTMSPQHTLNGSMFPSSNAQSQQPLAGAFPYVLSPIGEGSSYGRDMLYNTFANDNERTHVNGSGNGNGNGDGHIVVIKNLPRNTTEKELRSMLLFSKEYLGAEILSDVDENGFVSALARFGSLSGASEVKHALDGKPNHANDANMIVEFVSSNTSPSFVSRRSAFDAPLNRNQTNSTNSSGTSSNGVAARQSSRYNHSFQPIDRISPPSSSVLGNGHALSAVELPNPDTNSHFQSLFSPQSPIANHTDNRPRITGKSVINDEFVDDDDTGELIKDPMAFAKSGHASNGSMARRTTNPQMLTARFGSLSLSTNNINPQPAPGLTSPRGMAHMQTPASTLPPMSAHAFSPNGAYQNSSPFYPQRNNYPPVNPADQNPPCNTLYVGNLPIDTSEDELKQMFSKQRGYKRLCFRTKQNGPMCFVEFEDVSFATKALNELYGYPLHNSVKGGIRLSFSKNPLGVRSGQQGMNGAGMPTPTSPHGGLSGINGFGTLPGQPFSTASGPPPGLSAPPGLGSSNSLSSLNSPVQPGIMNGPYITPSFNAGNVGFNTMRPQSNGGSNTSSNHKQNPNKNQVQMHPQSPNQGTSGGSIANNMFQDYSDYLRGGR